MTGDHGCGGNVVTISTPVLTPPQLQQQRKDSLKKRELDKLTFTGGSRLTLA
jgi:hypothetical protein